LLRAFLYAPEDDEPLDEEDLAHLKEAERDLDEGRVVAREDVQNELGRWGLVLASP
jgi:predicted transcriptional regulator